MKPCRLCDDTGTIEIVKRKYPHMGGSIIETYCVCKKGNKMLQEFKRNKEMVI